MQTFDPSRRKILLTITSIAAALNINSAQAHHTDTHFDETTKHRIVYQCNKADPEYFSHLMFSVGELIRKHGDDIEIVVACFGPGIHLLGKRPERPVALEIQQRASSLADYGVRFHACKNTMDTLNWGEQDMVDFAKIVPIGVEDIMLLQEQGFTYFSW